MSSRHALRRTLTLLLVIACLGAIAWAGVAAWQRPCRLRGLERTQFGTPCPTLIEDLAPLAVALGICAIILVVEAMRRDASVMEFVAIAGILAIGKLSLIGSDGAFRLYFFLLAWVSPFFYRLHLRLIGEGTERWTRRLLQVFYALAVLWSIPTVFWTQAALQEMAWYGLWRDAIRLTAALAVTASVVVATRYSRRERSEARRRPIRLITFGNLAAMMPMLLLSLLPDTLRIPVKVPFEVTFFGLLTSPLLYAYAMLPYHMTRLDAFLRRASVYYLLVTLLASAFLVGTALMLSRFPRLVDHWPAMGIIVGALVLTVMEPLQRQLTRLTDWIWFGRSASYSGVVGRLAESLSTTLDRGVLERLLVRDLATAMHLSWSALYMRGQGEDLAPMSHYGAAPVELASTLPAGGALARYLEARAEPLRHEDLRTALATLWLCADERAMLDLRRVALWLPLVSGGVLHGILLLGPKAGDDFYTPQDHDILATLAHQSGIAAHNVRLVDQVTAGRQELARAHRQLLEASEQERRRLAQELHDGAVQQLIGISYQLAANHRRAYSAGSPDDGSEALLDILEMTRQEVLDVATQLRSMIGELRPPGLEELGLAAALHGYVSRLRREYGEGVPEIELDLNDGSAPIPTPVALILFRVAQEGLRNALKHAGASHVTLRLSSEGQQLTLTVRDDGAGFEVPPRLSELAARDHFGLVSIAERVAQVGGELTIRSDPGAGSEIIVHIDVSQEGGDGQLPYQGATGG